MSKQLVAKDFAEQYADRTILYEFCGREENGRVIGYSTNANSIILEISNPTYNGGHTGSYIKESNTIEINNNVLVAVVEIKEHYRYGWVSLMPHYFTFIKAVNVKQEIKNLIYKLEL